MKSDGDADPGPRLAQPADLGAILQRRVPALHGGEDAIRPGLHRQVQEADQLRHLRIDLDQAVRKLHRMAGGETDTVDAVDRGDIADQQGQIRGLARAGLVGQSAAIGIDVLPEQGDLAYALLGQGGDLRDHVVEGPADLFAARVGHDAVGTVLGAALHHGHEGGRSLGPGVGRQSNFSISGKETSTWGECRSAEIS